MRYRWLSVYPLLYAAAFVLISWRLLAGDGDLASFVHDQRLVVRGLAVVGCFAAFSAFSSGDHLRRAWFWLAVAMMVVLVRDVMRLFAARGEVAAVDWTISGLGVLGNVAFLVGVWMLARAWKLAAVSLPGGDTGFGVVTVVAAVLALVVAGPGAYRFLGMLLSGDWIGLVPVVSAVVDILSLCLLAPLLLTTLSLRGGLFAWPWGLVTTSMICWLLFDAAATFSGSLFGGTFPVHEIFRGLAENYLFAAGLAQSFVVGDVRKA